MEALRRMVRPFRRAVAATHSAGWCSRARPGRDQELALQAGGNDVEPSMAQNAACRGCSRPISGSGIERQLGPVERQLEQGQQRQLVERQLAARWQRQLVERELEQGRERELGQRQLEQGRQRQLELVVLLLPETRLRGASPEGEALFIRPA